MAGKEGESDGVERGLAERHRAALETVIADCVEALIATPLKPGDLMAIERKARPAGVIARTIKLVDSLKSKARKAVAETEEAADMSEGMVHCGAFPALEEDLMSLGAETAGKSPDRADALVWAVTHLLLDLKPGPRLRWL